MTTDRITHLEAELARQARAKAEAQTAREYATKQMRKARRERDRLAAVVERVGALADELDPAHDGHDFTHGHPDCTGCIHADLRALLDGAS